MLNKTHNATRQVTYLNCEYAKFCQQLYDFIRVAVISSIQVIQSQW